MTKQQQLNEALLNAIHRFTLSLRKKRISADIILHEFILLRKIPKDTDREERPCIPFRFELQIKSVKILYNGCIEIFRKERTDSKNTGCFRQTQTSRPYYR